MVYQSPNKLTGALLYKSIWDSGIRMQSLGVEVENLGWRVKE